MSITLVSIITPAYNASRFIENTIRSAQNQTYPHWEMLIVDDGSRDETPVIARNVSNLDPRIQVISLEENRGPAEARNAALQRARGDYIAFLDSDDLWLPKKLETQIEFMQAKDAALSYTQYRRTDLSCKSVSEVIKVPRQVRYHDLLKHNVIACLTAVVDRRKTGDFRMINEGYDDFILWLEILRKGFTAHGLQRDLARYRVVGGHSVSASRTQAIKWVWNIYRNVEEIPLAKSYWYFANYAVRTALKYRRHAHLKPLSALSE